MSTRYHLHSVGKMYGEERAVLRIESERHHMVSIPLTDKDLINLVVQAGNQLARLHTPSDTLHGMIERRDAKIARLEGRSA